MKTIVAFSLVFLLSSGAIIADENAPKVASFADAAVDGACTALIAAPVLRQFGVPSSYAVSAAFVLGSGASFGHKILTGTFAANNPAVVLRGVGRKLAVGGFTAAISQLASGSVKNIDWWTLARIGATAVLGVGATQAVAVKVPALK